MVVKEEGEGKEQTRGVLVEHGSEWKMSPSRAFSSLPELEAEEVEEPGLANWESLGESMAPPSSVKMPKPSVSGVPEDRSSGVEQHAHAFDAGLLQSPHLRAANRQPRAISRVGRTVPAWRASREGASVTAEESIECRYPCMTPSAREAVSPRPRLQGSPVLIGS